jgi:DNA-binding response OmpR family regulator
MPRMNGRELRAELKKTPEFSKIPVVAFTADRASADVLSIGADDYISKPPDLDALLTTVKYFCRRRKAGSASVGG